MLWTKFNGNIQIKLQHVLNEEEIRSGIEKELTGQFHCWIKIILFHSIFKATVEFMQKWMGPPSGFSIWDALSSLNRIGLFAWLIMSKLLKKLDLDSFCSFLSFEVVLNLFKASTLPLVNCCYHVCANTPNCYLGIMTVICLKFAAPHKPLLHCHWPPYSRGRSSGYSDSLNEMLNEQFRSSYS